MGMFWVVLGAVIGLLIGYAIGTVTERARWVRSVARGLREGRQNGNRRKGHREK